MTEVTEGTMPEFVVADSAFAPLRSALERHGSDDLVLTVRTSCAVGGVTRLVGRSTVRRAYPPVRFTRVAALAGVDLYADPTLLTACPHECLILEPLDLDVDPPLFELRPEGETEWRQRQRAALAHLSGCRGTRRQPFRSGSSVPVPR